MTTYTHCVTCSGNNYGGEDCGKASCPFPFPADTTDDEPNVVSINLPSVASDAPDPSVEVLETYNKICALPGVVAVSIGVQYDDGQNITLGKPAKAPGAPS